MDVRIYRAGDDELAPRVTPAIAATEKGEPASEQRYTSWNFGAFAETREVQRAGTALSELFAASPAPYSALPRDEWAVRAASMVPRRVERGPFSLRNRRGLLSPAEREEWRALNKHLGHGAGTLLAMYWTDGRRTLLEIADLVEDECGERDLQRLVRYYELLGKMDLVQIG